MKAGYPKAWQEGMTTGERIAAELRISIFQSDIEPNTVLTENKIAQQFNVSRSPVRDAFKLLHNDQLIHLERMGAKVLPFGEQEKRELYDLRLMLESFAFSKMKNKDVESVSKEMRKHLEMMKVAVQFEDADAFTQHDFKFHECLILSAEHQYLTTFWNHLKPIMEPLILLSMRQRMEQDKEDFERVHQNHEDYIQAVENYDKTKLKEAFHLNFDDVGKDFESFWQ